MSNKNNSNKDDVFEKEYFAKDVGREHDSSVYMNEKRKESPKEYFKFIFKETKQYFKEFQEPRILDVGCATGDFLYFLEKQKQKVILNGIEVLEELLDIAKNEVPNSSFSRGDICIKKTLPETKFDIAYMIGVHTLFDNVEHWLDNFLDLIQDGGYGFIFSFYNTDDYDVLIKVRKSGTDGKWQAGWNVLSKKTFSDFLKKRNIKHEFIQWEIEIDIEKNLEDPLRGWTLKMDGGKRLIRNTCCFQDFYLLKIYK